MDARVKKSQSLYSLGTLVCLVICIVLGLIGYFADASRTSILVVVMSFITMFVHCFYIFRLKKQLFQLITMSENILEQKDVEMSVIDGESYVAVLSSHLFLLDKRMKHMLAQLSKEQDHLKTYIEDISHQMKTPLTSLLLKEDILLEKLPDEKEHIEQMIFQTQKLQHFIESLLHLAQIESHSVTYHFHEYDTLELFYSIEQNLKPLLEDNDVKLLYQKGTIYCDFQWMEEALENIIKNSIEQQKHSTIEITCQNYQSYIQIKIQDHGPGFQEADIPHLFKRFYHHENQKNSIGIGLSLCHAIICDHHGTIEAYNNHGALFVITLPNKMTKSKYTVTKE